MISVEGNKNKASSKMGYAFTSVPYRQQQHHFGGGKKKKWSKSSWLDTKIDTSRLPTAFSQHIPTGVSGRLKGLTVSQLGKNLLLTKGGPGSAMKGSKSGSLPSKGRLMGPVGSTALVKKHDIPAGSVRKTGKKAKLKAMYGKTKRARAEAKKAHKWLMGDSKEAKMARKMVRNLPKAYGKYQEYKPSTIATKGAVGLAGMLGSYAVERYLDSLLSGSDGSNGTQQQRNAAAATSVALMNQGLQGRSNQQSVNRELTRARGQRRGYYYTPQTREARRHQMMQHYYMMGDPYRYRQTMMYGASKPTGYYQRARAWGTGAGKKKKRRKKKRGVKKRRGKRRGKKRGAARRFSPAAAIKGLKAMNTIAGRAKHARLKDIFDF